VKTIVAKNVGICIDLWNWHVGGGAVEQIRDLPPDRIVTVRLADIPRNVPLEKLTDEDRLLPATTGIVPAASAIEILTEIGYEGPVTVYCHPSRFLNMPRNRVANDTARALDRVFGLTDEPLEEPEISDGPEAEVETAVAS
jgi:sugar phosphate isomerase/epimerase